jgi:hypothetical protein
MRLQHPVNVFALEPGELRAAIAELQIEQGDGNRLSVGMPGYSLVGRQWKL